MKNCNVCEALQDDRDLIFDTKHWRVVLNRSDQYYLGRSLVVTKRHVADLAELTPEEWNDFHALIRRFENAFRIGFKAVAFNWSCLMNNAYQAKPYNPHVHWHVRPRYDQPISLDGQTFEDKEFGHHYARETDNPVSEKTARHIIDTIQLSLQT